jgi:hypothetical protein
MRCRRQAWPEKGITAVQNRKIGRNNFTIRMGFRQGFRRFKNTLPMRPQNAVQNKTPAIPNYGLAPRTLFAFTGLSSGLLI